MWLIFGLLISLVPVVWHVVELVGKDELHSWWDIFTTGELIVIAAVLASASAGDFLRKKANGLTHLELVILGSTFTLLFMSGWLYAFVRSEDASHHKNLVGYCCLGPFVASLLIGASIIFIDSEEGHR